MAALTYVNDEKKKITHARSVNGGNWQIEKEGGDYPTFNYREKQKTQRMAVYYEKFMQKTNRGRALTSKKSKTNLRCLKGNQDS